MMRFLKFVAVIALGVGSVYGMTRQPVIDASPEPIKTGLQKVRLDMDRVANGTGWEGKKKPSGGDSGGGSIPLLQKHGITN
jgi:hypothetical protein